MLVIKKSQVQAFEDAACSSFEDQMVVHARAFSPRLHQIIGDNQMREMVRIGISDAFAYGFTRRGPAQLYIELMLLFGSSFSSDPQYPWAVELLRAGDAISQMGRAERLHAEVVKYLKNVHGPDNRYVYEALQRIAESSPEDINFPSGDIEGNLLEFLKSVHPQKYSYTKRDALAALVQEAIRKTRDYTGGCDGHDAGLMAALLFSFGHGCDVDPLYPWIKKTLEREPRTGSLSRMKILERKSLLWLKAVLKNERGETHD